MNVQTTVTQIEIESPSDSRPSSPESDLEPPIETSPLRSVRPDILTALKPFHLSPDFISKKSNVIGNGTFGDVKKALCNHPQHGKITVAIKYLRISNNEEVIALFEKEVYVWSKLNHPNILPLLGFFFESGYPSFISKWMRNGSAWNYVKANPDCDLNRLIIGSAEGLAYLHEKNVIHSDIKPDNIVVSTSGDARICDFGGSRIIDSSKSLALPTAGLRGTSRYHAYELVVPSELPQGHTMSTDVWALGMTIFALLAMEHPFAQYRDSQLSLVIQKKELPTLPPSDNWTSQRLEAKEALWNICQLCWNYDPASRAEMSLIKFELRKLSKKTELASGCGLSRSDAECATTVSLSSADPHQRIKVREGNEQSSNLSESTSSNDLYHRQQHTQVVSAEDGVDDGIGAMTQEQIKEIVETIDDKKELVEGSEGIARQLRSLSDGKSVSVSSLRTDLKKVEKAGRRIRDRFTSGKISLRNLF